MEEACWHGLEKLNLLKLQQCDKSSYPYKTYLPLSGAHDFRVFATFSLSEPNKLSYQYSGLPRDSIEFPNY